MNNEPKCDNKEPHSHLVAGRTFECEKGQQEEKTYDINNTKQFIKQFTREDGLLELGKYNHDALAEAVVKDRQEAYEAGRREGLESLDNKRDSVWRILSEMDTNIKSEKEYAQEIINKLKD